MLRHDHPTALNLAPFSAALVIAPTGAWVFLIVTAEWVSGIALAAVLACGVLVALGAGTCLLTVYLTEPGILMTQSEELPSVHSPEVAADPPMDGGRWGAAAASEYLEEKGAGGSKAALDPSKAALSTLSQSRGAEDAISHAREKDSTTNNRHSHWYIVVDGGRYELPELRAKFCRQSSNCVENFDHFCPWTGNVIGVRNYKFFFFFVTCVVLLCVVVFSTSLVCFIWSTRDVKEWINAFTGPHSDTATVSTLLMVYAVVMSFAIFPLWFFHIGLICSATTTNEAIRGVWAGRANPNDLGCMGNCSRALCRRSRASYLTSNMHTPLIAEPGGPQSRV